MGAASDDDEREASVLRELAHILSSESFEASDRNRRFLRYVVEETLGGRGDRIKAYTIATAVFGRSDDFDPQQDSIVRIEAARLRRALEHYYLKQGETPDLRISIPKGTYVPEFRMADDGQGIPAPAADVAIPARIHTLGPRIMVENLDQEGDLERFPTIGRALTRQIIAALTRFSELFVYGFDTTEDQHRLGKSEDFDVDYRFLGCVTISKEALRAEVMMKRTGDGRFIWVQSVQRPLGEEPDPSRIVSLCSEIAGEVARAVARRDGIMDGQARDSAGDAPRHFSSYQKLLDFQDYWRSLDPSLFEPLRQDLEATIAADPRFAAAYASLSMLYTNAARYGYDLGARCVFPLERAMDLARRAARLAPDSSRAFHALAIAEWFSGMPEQALATLQTARDLNPNDPEILAELGLRYAMRMEWGAAVPLLEEAYLRNPLQSGQYRMGLFLYHFAMGRHELALQEAHAIDSPSIAHVHIAAAAALGQLGRMAEARHRLQEAARLAPGLRSRLREDLLFRQIHPDLIAALMDALRNIDLTGASPARTGLSGRSPGRAPRAPSR